MGIRIFCNDCNYYVSSCKWNDIKYNLFFYCLMYIKKKYTLPINCDINNMSVSIYKLNNDLTNTYRTLFEKAKLSGINNLINANDYDDYYSIKDASVILNMLLTIYDIMLYSDKIVTDKLIVLFRSSVQNSIIVKIE